MAWLERLLELGDLVDAAGVAATLERRRQEHVDDLVGESFPDDASADRQHVGVVVLASEPGGVEAVAQRRPYAAHLVGGELLALAAATEYDPDVGVAVAHRARRRSTERRVVDALGRIGAVVDDLVTGCPQPLDQVLLEL